MTDTSENMTGKVIRVFSIKETRKIEREWLQVYGKNRRGVNAKSYKWHVFSFDRYPALEGERALAEYAKQVPGECIVLPNDNHETAVLTRERPVGGDGRDYYVFPVNMAWTMAFTHEEGWLGPYFAKHPDYAKLDADNLAKVRKAEEKAAAVKKGWAAPDVLEKYDCSVDYLKNR